MSSTRVRFIWLLTACTLGGSMLLFASCQQQPAPPSVVEAPTTKPADASTSVATTMPSQIDYRALGFHYPPAPTNDESRDRKPGREIATLNAICTACHKPGGGPAVSHTDSDTMHTTGVSLACIECHGGVGDPTLKSVRADIKPTDPDYAATRRRAHVMPATDVKLWDSSAKPEIAFTKWLKESPDFIRFVNPGDLRAARVACASCHETQVKNVPKSMMATGAMLWEAALYNNGSINRKAAIYGEAYAPDGRPATIIANPLPTVGQVRDYGILPALFPLPRWEVTQPGNILRVFERGGMFPPSLGIPDSEESPGRPDAKLSVRGLGTNLRTDPVSIGLQKTRLLDPTLNMLGTNDHPGDFRSSGCTACHVVYANDRNPVHSTFWSKYGNRGESFSIDGAVNPAANPTTRPATQPYDDPDQLAIDHRQPGHPIQHVFVRNMPTSSCIVCHVHPGTNVLNSYLGYMWWDNETDGWFMYPRQQVNPTSDQEFASSQHNPEAAAARGLWSNLYPDLENHRGQKSGKDFLENITRLNPLLQHGQFADFHGHGWVFRAVFKQDRDGRMLDYSDKPVDANPSTIAERMAQGVKFVQAPDKDKHPPANVPVHMKDIHLEKGMQCVDCHFSTDAHGNGNLYGETRNAVIVTCADCHGTAEEPSPILSYFKALADGKDDDAKKLLLRAFSGTGAAAGMTPDLIRKRNADLIKGHFNQDESIESLIQKNVSYEQAKAISDKTGVPVDLKGMFPSWTVTQTIDTTKPGFKAPDADDDKEGERRGKLARYAHTVRRNMQWGTTPQADEAGAGNPAARLAHSNKNVSCYACHSGWNTSCFGCHLPQKANQRTPMLHNEGAITRNYTSYNYQTLRNDIYMLGVDSTAKNHQVVPVRSACAIVVSSQNVNRSWIYGQQQTVSAEGFAGTAFSPNFPHTVRSAETKQCADCHLSKAGDNNALMAQLLMQGTNSVNFIGRFAWVAEGSGGLQAVAVTERDEPQAVIGSRLHEMAYPANFARHRDGGGKLTEAYDHAGQVLDVQLRGEYLYAACGSDGFIAYDVANIDNKDFSERIVTAPVSPLGQRLYVRSKYATSICSPSTLAVDPARSWTQEDRAKEIPGWRPENEEGKITEIGDRKKVLELHRKIHPLYGFLYLTDREEGLIVIGNALDNKFTGPGVTTLLDGNPRNNFLDRALTFNPAGLLTGARHMDLYGTYAYISCDAGLVVLDLDDPLHPKHVTTLSAGLSHPRKVQFQFRYGFVIDDEGLKVIDVTFPNQPRLVKDAFVHIGDARDIYICRTYGYVAAGDAGLVIIDLKKPETPQLDQKFEWGRISKFETRDTSADATAVRVGMTNTSLFAYVADGKNGLKVIQLTSPDDTPTFSGFSPRPAPRIIATYPTRGPAISLSKGVDRDRAVDENGNQLAVFGRKGSRPFTLAEQRRFYFHDAPPSGNPNPNSFYTVDDMPDDGKRIDPRP